MNYKITIIEDDSEAYRILHEKIIEFNNNSIHKLELQDITISKNYTFDEYIQKIISLESDIYIVDWQLKFKENEEYNPKEIFSKLKFKKFKFNQKYWIFYSKPHSDILLDFTRDYFNQSYCYDTPGKANILGKITASGKNHFLDCIKKAIDFLSIISIPDTIQKIEIDNLHKIEIPYFGSHGYSLFSNDYLKASEKRAFTINPELLVCFAYDSSYGIIIYFNEVDNDKILQLYLVKLNDSAIVFKKSMADYTKIINNKGFIYNPNFFQSNSIIKTEFQEYFNQLLSIIKNEITIGKFRKVDITKLIEIFKNHQLMR